MPFSCLSEKVNRVGSEVMEMRGRWMWTRMRVSAGFVGLLERRDRNETVVCGKRRSSRAYMCR